MFIAYEVSLELIRSLRDIVPKIKKFDRDLADQIHRAATSVTLNLGEGSRNTAGHQRIGPRQRERSERRAPRRRIVGLDR
jgi:hypothetical protein